jgi:hypothetical protein
MWFEMVNFYIAKEKKIEAIASISSVALPDTEICRLSEHNI